MDAERFLSLACGMLLIALIWLSLLLVSGIDLHRRVKYVRVMIKQNMTAEDRRFWRNVLRMAYLYVLIYAGLMR